MIKFENIEVVGFKPAIRGMRNPMNSWAKSDSSIKCTMDTVGECLNKKEYLLCEDCKDFKIGPNDLDLMMRLAQGGSVQAKYRRMIVVYMDIIAPLYWWKEFDTYKVGTVANSCSTMHKIASKEFELSDFSHEHLIVEDDVNIINMVRWLQKQIDILNEWRKNFNDIDSFSNPDKKKYWWQMIQLLPSSYNQRRTVMLDYEVLAGIYPMRKDHKLDEWRDFCKMIESLPYSEVITGDLKGEQK